MLALPRTEQMAVGQTQGLWHCGMNAGTPLLQQQQEGQTVTS